MAQKRTPESNQYEGHGEDYAAPTQIKKGTFIYVGTYSPQEAEISVNQKTANGEKGE